MGLVSVYEQRQPDSAIFNPDAIPSLKEKFAKLSNEVSQELKRQGFKPDQIHLECYLNLR